MTTSVNVGGKDYTFTADVYYEEAANKTKLAETLDQANTLLNDAVVGTEPGQYSQESVDTFRAAITAAQMVLDNLDAEQEQVDAAVASLKEAITTFRNSVIVPTVPYTEVNVTDLINEKAEWNLFEEGLSTYTFQDEPVALTLTSSDSTNNKYAKANYLGEKFKNTLFKFKYEANTIAENGWVGFYINDSVDNPSTFPWSGHGVLVVIKENSVELQVRGANDYFKADSSKYTKAVEYMEPDQVYDVTFGMYDESGTEVRIILTIDGDELFNEVIADSDLLSSENYFGTLASPGEASITLGNLSNNGIFHGFYDFDDFNTTKNWAVKGTPTRSEEQAYSGRYSYKLDEDKDSIRVNTSIAKGDVVSVMLYDNMSENVGLGIFVDSTSTGGEEEPEVSIEVEATAIVNAKGGTTQMVATVTNLPEGTDVTLEYTPVEGTNAMISKAGLITGVTATSEAEALTTTVTAKDSSGEVVATKEVTINVTVNDTNGDSYGKRGTPTRASEQAYSGLYSYRLDEDRDCIRWQWDTAQSGHIVSIMMYDTMTRNNNMGFGFYIDGSGKGLCISGKSAAFS